MKSGCLILFLLAVNLSLFAQSLLWELSIPNFSPKSYLYGTIHVADSRVFAYCDSVEYFLKKSNLFVPEVVIDNEEIRQYTKVFLLPCGQTIKSLIGVVDYKMLKSKLKQSGNGAMALLVNKMKPIAFIEHLESTGSKKYKVNKILDQYLQDLAKQSSIPMLGLETIKDQIKALESVSIEVQVKMLKEALHKPNDETSEYEKLISDYLSQDINYIEQITSEALNKEDTNITYALQNNRNSKMTESIFGLIKSKSCFMAIGVAHLGGTGGVLSLLQSKGVSVRPVKCSFK